MRGIVAVRRALVMGAIAVSSGAAASGARPLWPGDVAVATGPGDQGISVTQPPGVVALPDGAGGVIIVFQDMTTGNLLAQRLDSGGHALWGASPIAVAPNAAWQMAPSAAADGAGGAIVAWVDGRNDKFCNPAFEGTCDIYAQRLSATGHAVWAAAGAPVVTAPNNQGTSGIAIAADGKGGAFFAWEDARGTCCTFWAQRLDATGAPVWATDGVQVSPDPTKVIGPVGLAPQIVPDGADGVLVAWLNMQVDPVAQIPDIRAQRLDGQGKALFAAGGVHVIEIIREGFALVSDGAGGAIAVSPVRGADAADDIRAQRISAAGGLLWDTAGAPIAIEPYFQTWPRAVSDGQGGVIAVWEDERGNVLGNCPDYDPGCDFYAQRLDASGSALWTTGGVFLTGGLPGRELPLLIGTANGGAIVAWQDCRMVAAGLPCDFSRDLAAQKLGGDGSLLWGANGVFVTTGAFNQGVNYGSVHIPSFALAPDGAGGAFLAWPDGRAIPCAITVGQRECDLYAQHISDAQGPRTVADLGIAVMSAAGSKTLALGITNHGPATAEGVNVVMSFAGLALITGGQASQGQCYLPATYYGPICGLGPLAAGGTATVSIDYDNLPETCAQVYSGEDDPGGFPNSTCGADGGDGGGSDGGPGNSSDAGSDGGAPAGGPNPRSGGCSAAPAGGPWLPLLAALGWIIHRTRKSS